MPANQDLELYQGDSFAASVTVSNEDGTPADISSYTATAQIRRAVADADPVVVADITCTTESPLVHLSLTAAQTTALNGRYMWDLQLAGGAGEVITILRGAVKLTAEITRAAA